MTRDDDPAAVYRAIGISPIICASGAVTQYGGSKLRPEVMESMNQAAAVMVSIEELNRKASETIAKVTGAEAGLVTSGSAGGLILQAAACTAGSDPVKMAQLPDTTGLKNEVLIHNSHRFPYDQLYRATGAELVGFGDGRRCHPWQLEGAFTDRTAAVAYVLAPFISRRALTLEQVCEMAHARDVPVIIDAAGAIPPRANLRKYISEGADMVIYSGGKGVRGPQGTGILCGRADLIEAASANASPRQFIGRGMKVAKEEIVGLLIALQLFLEEDEEAETRRYREMCQQVVDALVEFPGLRVTIEHDDHSYLIPTALMTYTREWNGPSRDQVYSAMADGDPPIFLHNLGAPDELAVDPFNLDEAELQTVIRRLREELLGPTR